MSRSALGLAATLIVVVMGSPALAVPEPDPVKPKGGRDTRGFWSTVTADDGSVPVHDNDGAPAHPWISSGNAACPGAVPVSDVATNANASVRLCGAVEQAEVAVGAVATAFARLDLPAGDLVIQPPDGVTLVNFDTNFYTTSTRPLTRTVTLLGRQVTIEATPAEFTWHFGDDHHHTTTSPGAAYPDLQITHNYQRKGTYRPSLATTYTGRFRVGTNPWRNIPGTVTITGTPQDLRAIEATPTLVGY